MSHDLGRFDLNLLVAFDALMTERGVTRAGRTLGITQAAMSNTLRRLREIFNDPLFVKTGHRMEPTVRAIELAVPISKALHQVRMALNQERFDPATSNQIFRIGMVDYAAAMLLPLLAPHLARHAPHVTLEVVDVGGEEEVTALENGVVDLVFSRFQWVPPKVLLYRLGQVEYVCVMRKDHAATESDLTLEKFLSARHVHYYPRGMDSTVVDDALAQMGRQRQIVVRLFSLVNVPGLLVEADMMAVMPELTARYLCRHYDVQSKKLPFETSKLQMAIAWHPRMDHMSANIWFRDQVKELLATLQQWESLADDVSEA